MIRALLVALQLAAATAPVGGPDGVLVVKDASRAIQVQLTPTPDGPLLRADALRPVVPVTVSHLMGDRWMIIVNGVAIEVVPGRRFAKVGDEHYQLAAAPIVTKGALYVPLQLVVEIVPRLTCSSAFTSTPPTPAGGIPARPVASRRTSSPRRRPRTTGAWSGWKTRS